MEYVIYIVLIGLGILLGYKIGCDRDLAYIEVEYERKLNEYFKTVEAWQKEYLKLYEAYRALQDSININDEDVK